MKSHLNETQAQLHLYAQNAAKLTTEKKEFTTLRFGIQIPQKKSKTSNTFRALLTSILCLRKAPTLAIVDLLTLTLTRTNCIGCNCKI